jgi:hypothetical protein
MEAGGFKSLASPHAFRGKRLFSSQGIAATLIQVAELDP